MNIYNDTVIRQQRGTRIRHFHPSSSEKYSSFLCKQLRRRWSIPASHSCSLYIASSSLLYSPSSEGDPFLRHFPPSHCSTQNNPITLCDFILNSNLGPMSYNSIIMLRQRPIRLGIPICLKQRPTWLVPQITYQSATSRTRTRLLDNTQIIYIS